MRRENDRYLTDAWSTRQLLSRVDISGSVMELCCGEKDIVRVLEQEGMRNRVDTIYTNDIDHTMNPDYTFDATNPVIYNNSYDQFSLPTVDWHITNPPYNVAAKIIPLAYQHARVGIAMLLRLTYLEPCTKSKNSKFVKRGFWLKDYPPTDLIVLPRYSYTNDGKTDSVTSAWMVWDKTYMHGLTERNQRIFCVPDDRTGED